MKKFVTLARLSVVLCVNAQTWRIVKKNGEIVHYPASDVEYVTVIDDLNETVDLGLRSRTLWAKYNIGATSPEEYGDYFAWGEVEGVIKGKLHFYWNTYKWCTDVRGEELTKYNTADSLGIVDNKLELDLEDDAAYVNWGPNWRMPTWGQILELMQSCTWEREMLNEVEGYKLTGPNGNTIFFPAGGWYQWEPSGAGQGGDYWGRTLNGDKPTTARGFWFYEDGCGWAPAFRRYFGRMVRPVHIQRANR